MNYNTTLIEESGKVTQFIESLNETELLILWKTANTPEYIGLIASKLKEEVDQARTIMLQPITNNA